MDDERVPLSASEARQQAQRHLSEDNERWRIIRPLTTKLKELRTDDALSTAMAKEWGKRR